MTFTFNWFLNYLKKMNSNIDLSVASNLALEGTTIQGRRCADRRWCTHSMEVTGQVDLKFIWQLHTLSCFHTGKLFAVFLHYFFDYLYACPDLKLNNLYKELTFPQLSTLSLLDDNIASVLRKASSVYKVQDKHLSSVGPFRQAGCILRSEIHITRNKLCRVVDVMFSVYFLHQEELLNADLASLSSNRWRFSLSVQHLSVF